MKSLDEKQILDLIVSKFGSDNIEPHFGKDDISIMSLNSFTNKIDTAELLLSVTCDMLVEHTDVPPSMTFEQIARKSMVSSISDLVSKGIKPKFTLISLGLPLNLKKSEISELLSGFSQISKEFKIDIVGGDINESNELIIDCCMFGTSSSTVHVPRRNGAQEGDYVVVSGVFGFTASGLKILIQHVPSPDIHFENESIDSVLNPTPSYDFGLSLAKYFSASTDSSDGLASALYEISKQSGVDLLIHSEKIPTPPSLNEFSLMNRLEFSDLVFYGGEEYHFVGTISEKNLSDISQYVKDRQLDFFVVGKVSKGCGKVFVINANGNKEILEQRGFQHFT